MTEAATRRFHLAVYTDSSLIGGGERALATLLGGLDERISVTVLGTSESVVQEIASARPGVRTRKVPFVRHKRDLPAMAAHLRIVRELRPDILQTNGDPWSCQYAVGAGLLTRGVRTLAVHHQVQTPPRRGQLWRNRPGLRRVDAQVVVARQSARLLEGLIGRHRGTVRVIHNGVADRVPDPVPRPAEGPIVGSIGRLSWEKGYDVLLRALAEIPDAVAVLVGDGPERRNLESLARRLDLEGRVVMPGWCDDPRPWLTTFDIFAMPSRTEALPIAIVEAMLAERPVVGTRVGGVPEVVIEDRTGLLAAPGSVAELAAALRRLIADDSMRARMGSAGRKLARREFSLDGMVNSYQALYRELLCPTGGGSASR